LKITEARVDNFAEKHPEKRNYIVVMPPSTIQFLPSWVDLAVPAQSTEEKQRVIIVFHPSKSSVSTKLHHACREQETQSLGNVFCTVTLMMFCKDLL
jgi:hypothetical protein